MLALADESRTMIFYESPYRLVKALEQMSEIFGPERKACVAREISKKFEDYKRGTLAELQHHFTENGVKGEIVMLVAGKTMKKKLRKKKKESCVSSPFLFLRKHLPDSTWLPISILISSSHPL